MCFYKKKEKTEIFPIIKNNTNQIEKKISVLIVDDNPIYKKIINKYLNNIGYLVICSSNGKEALELVKCISFDLIMCDVHMPVMDGIEFFKIINQMKINASIFILYSDYDIINYVTEMNLDFYVNKRFTPKEIENIIINNNVI